MATGDGQGAAAPTDAVASRPPRQRFVLLDGMRGIAALAVALFHFAYMLRRPDLAPNGAIAVDFFFCLSGFVIAFAHDHQFRESTLRWSRFVSLRLIRIGPMVWLGTILGTALLPVYPDGMKLHGHDIFPTILMSFLSLPWFSEGIALWVNGVFWSLSAELLANVLYASFGRHLNNVWLAIVIVVSSLILLLSGYHQPPWTGRFETLSTFPYAITRATTSFFIGVALLRFWRNDKARPFVSWLIPIGLLLLMLAWTNKGEPVAWFNLLAVFSLIPAAVYFGACVNQEATRLFERLGEASFPLYALHLPILAVLARAVRHFPVSLMLPLLLLIPLSLLVSCISVARSVDEPGRLWLRRRLFPLRAAAS